MVTMIYGQIDNYRILNSHINILNSSNCKLNLTYEETSVLLSVLYHHILKRQKNLKNDESLKTDELVAIMAAIQAHRENDRRRKVRKVGKSICTIQRQIKNIYWWKVSNRIK